MTRTGNQWIIVIRFMKQLHFSAEAGGLRILPPLRMKLRTSGFDLPLERFALDFETAHLTVDTVELFRAAVDFQPEPR